MCASLPSPSVLPHLFDGLIIIIIHHPLQVWARCSSPNPLIPLQIPPAGALRHVHLSKKFHARFGERSQNRFAPVRSCLRMLLLCYEAAKLYHRCSVGMPYTRLIFPTMSKLRARDCAIPRPASTGELCERFLSSTSPPWRILTISRRRTRCCPLSSGGPPPNARAHPFSELVASMRAVCACLHMEVQNVTCARCNASGPRVFCLQWAELVLGLLHAPPHGQGCQQYRPRSWSFVSIFRRFKTCVLGGVLWLCFCHCELKCHGIMVIMGSTGVYSLRCACPTRL